MAHNAAASDSVADWHTPATHTRLITPLNLAGLVVAIGTVLFLLYPQQRLEEQLRQNPQVDEVSLQYMRSLLTTQPSNPALRLQLARAYAQTGKYAEALKTLNRLYTNAQADWREAGYLAQLDILQKMTFATPPGSPQRARRLAELRRAMRLAEPHIYRIEALRSLVRSAESTGETELAERVLSQLVRSSPQLEDLAHAARRALGNQHYLVSAQYSWRAMQLARLPAERMRYLLQSLDTLQAGGLGALAITWVKQLPPSARDVPMLHYRLIKLALASGQPAQAAEFARALVGFDSRVQPRFIPAYYELAYSAFLGNRDLPDALRLSQLAVAASPASPASAIWRERLAHVAEWSGQPQIALIQWRWLATHRGSESAWQAMQRLAGGLFDYATQIMGLEHAWQQQGKRDEYARKLVQTYEYMGQPEAALAWLARNADEAAHPPLLLLSAELLARMGRDSEAIERYRRYLLHNRAQPDVAVAISALMQRAGNYEAAFAVLDQSRGLARPTDVLFWQNLGELAWRLRHYETAIIAYQALSNAPDAALYQQVRLVLALKHQNPALAAQTAERYWLKTRQLELFMNAVDIYAEQADWRSVKRLYQLAAADKSFPYEADLRFVAVRAEMYRQTGEFAAAARDYLFLIQRYPGDSNLKQAYIWLLLDTRQLTQLDTRMRQWAGGVGANPDLWEVYAAGYLALGRPAYALVLYQRMAPARLQDELWMLNYASTLEAAGQTGLAWQIRRKLWQQRLASKRPTDWLTSGAHALDIERLRLVLLNDPVRGQGVLWKLLRSGAPALRQAPQFVELASAWLNDHDQNDASRIWLLRRYAHWLDTPLGVQLADALTRQDAGAAAALLDQHAGLLLHDKMNLSILAGRVDDAADLAFRAMEAAPDDAALQQQSAPLLLQNARTVGLESGYSEPGGYTAMRHEISVTNYPLGGLKLDLNLRQTSRSQVDTRVLTRAPNEIAAELALRQVGTGMTQTFKLQLSQGLNTQAGLSFSRQQQLGARLLLDAQLGYNQTANETAALRIVGRRDQLALEALYSLDRWTQWSVRGEYNRYRSIDGQALGSGQVLTGTLTHSLGTHPALRARVSANWSGYQTRTSPLGGTSASLVPSGQPVTPAYFMPRAQREIAAYVSLGDAVSSPLPARNLEYQAEIGVFYNDVAGAGVRANAGIATRVLGADRLQLFTRFDQAPSGQVKPSLEAGIGYYLTY
jgi:thioredoxin-like negative regulator of GroEL